ncbi:MAG: hypothetical protein EBZ75_01765 [Oxalobacteraceae bacterium]|nr:hypothetical protein [Oxalobacteraceae bacterium]
MIEGSPILLTHADDLQSNGVEKRCKNAPETHSHLFRSEVATITRDFFAPQRSLSLAHWRLAATVPVTQSLGPRLVEVRYAAQHARRMTVSAASDKKPGA